MKENTPVEVCLGHYLSCLIHFAENHDQDYFLEAKHVLQSFTSWLREREIRLVRELTEFLIREYDLHLEDQLAQQEIDQRTASLIRDRVDDFLGYCVRARYLKTNPNRGTL